MADQSPPLQFEDVPLDEARRMGRGPRMEPMRYETRRQKIQALSIQAVHSHLGPEITPTRRNNYLVQIARELNVPVTLRRIPGGVVFWRSSAEDLQQAQEVGARLQTGQRRLQTRPGGRRPRETC
jgi:hypothetical protein